MVLLKNREHFSLIYSGGFAQMVPKPAARPENRHQAKPRYGMENPVCEYYSRILREENIRMGFGHGEARHLHAKIRILLHSARHLILGKEPIGAV
ncbi:MAG: hypothetical protein O7A08_06535 [SAR324 cluster bacterium]|nr:hypothetical protein [SAR324 cluster bacterium]